MSKKIKLTQEIVAQARSEKSKYVLWDKEISGFGIEVHPGGSKRYFLKRRFNGRQIRPTFGRHGDMKLSTARAAAIDTISMINAGLDPTLRSKLNKDTPTVEDLMNEFMERHGDVNLKPKSIKEYRNLIRNHIVPKLGHLKINDVSAVDIESLKHKLKDKRTTANRCLEVLSVAFNKAEKWGLRDVTNGNPCKHVDLYRLKKRKVYLEPDELALLMQAMADYREENAFAHSAIDAITLLIHTGARRNEIRTLQWNYINFERGLIHLPDSKTGQKDIVLTPAAVNFLKSIQSRDTSLNKYVFIGGEGGTVLTESTLYKHWHRAVNRARMIGLNKPDLRIHDLRHTFASIGVASGLSLQTIGELLGHKTVATTQRYAHLYTKAKHQAANLIGQTISNAAE